MNYLSKESSPYLLQHAHNPVHWHAWNEEALARAVREDKPILVSIGYATCHWCHVMERESFENDEVAAVMNELFVCIKVDREERPDVDQIYMEACQAISGSGGWPLNAFLLPDGRPFYAGTYYPPAAKYDRPGWTDLLRSLSEAFTGKRSEVEAQAGRLTGSIKGSGLKLLGIEPEAGDHEAWRSGVVGKLRDTYDHQYGGFGGAPKFPMSQSLEALPGPRRAPRRGRGYSSGAPRCHGHAGRWYLRSDRRRVQPLHRRWRLAGASLREDAVR